MTDLSTDTVQPQVTREPFHVSRSSDGERQWFSARDPASGVTIPAKDRDDAYALVSSLNRACLVFAERHRTASTPQGADVEGLRADVALWKREAADRSEGMVEINLDRAAMGVENMKLREKLERAEAVQLNLVRRGAHFRNAGIKQAAALIEELSKRPSTQWGEVKTAILALVDDEPTFDDVECPNCARQALSRQEMDAAPDTGKPPAESDLERHIFEWFNDRDCDEMRACLEAYDARVAQGEARHDA